MDPPSKCDELPEKNRSRSNFRTLKSTNSKSVGAGGSAAKSGDVVRKESRDLLRLFRLRIAMLCDKDGDRPIHMAVASGNIKVVHKMCKIMLQNSISLNLTNYLRQCPLHIAIMLGKSEIIRLLLKCGASLLLRDCNGNTVLHLAAKCATPKAMLELLLSQDKVETILDDKDNDGYSALHYAILRNNKTAVICMHQHGALMENIDGKSGRTPLHHAIVLQNAPMVKLLLECGANVRTTDYSGRSSEDLSLLIPNKNIAGILNSHRSAAITETLD